MYLKSIILKLLSIFILLAISSFMLGCGGGDGTDNDNSNNSTYKIYTDSYGRSVYEINTSSFTATWDYSGDVDSFNVYYRIHGENSWTLLDTTADQEYQIAYSDLRNAEFHDIAVTAIYEGKESAIHHSMDDSAIPATGWYIEWINQ